MVRLLNGSFMATVGFALAGMVAVAQQSPAPNLLQAPRAGSGFILGKVVDSSTNEPVEGAIVDLQYAGPVTGAYQSALVLSPAGSPPEPPRRVLTDPQGHFFFRQLIGGRYIAAVSAPGYAGGGYLQLKPGG